MNHVDIDCFQAMCEGFSRATGITTELVCGPDRQVIFGTGRRDICDRYHRVCPASRAHCRQNDVILASQLSKRKKICVGRCGNGLAHGATPIIIGNVRVADLFIGRVLLEPPDRGRFTARAEECGFEMAAYLDALAQVPVVTEKKFKRAIAFLNNMGAMLAGWKPEGPGVRRNNGIPAGRKRDFDDEVSDRIQAEEALRKSEEYLRSIFRVAPAGIGVVVDRVLTQVNERLCEMTGYTEQELIGQSARILYPSDEDYQYVGREKYRQIKDHGTGIVETRWKHKNDSIIDVMLSSTPMDPDDLSKGVTFTALNITERKRVEHQLRESEARFRALFNNAAEGILVADLQTRQFVYANPAICRMLGYTEQELTSIGLKEIHPPESLAHTIAEFEAQARGEKILAPDIACRRKDGSVIYADINTARVDLDGREHNIGLFSDVTERRNAEMERLRRQKLESLGTIAGGIAHDFNNLLMGVFGNIEMARMGLPDSHPSGRYLDNAGSALERARRLTGQLLTFARGGDPVREVVDIREMVREAISFHLSGSNILPRFELPDDIWPVKADKGQIGQVLANLIINAVQAMPAGGCLHVSAANVEDLEESRAPSMPGQWVRLSIRDEGTGIPAKIIDRIFDPYFTTKQNGSGLGLAVAHGVINRHGGRISVDSTPDVGTTFTIFFPADPAAAIESPRQVSRAEESAGRKPRRILFMDDNDAIRKLGVSMLNTFGHSVEVARDGQDAVAQYTAAMEQGHPFDLVILDLTVPGGMGGREAVQKILAVDPNARAIVSSGYSSDPVLANYRDYGFSGELVKPFTMASLATEIARVLADD